MTDVMTQEIADVDLSKIAALQQKRTLAFVNHFVITTVQFLNNFSKKCEQHLMQFERKIEKLSATMVLLEAKLSSIPELNNSSIETPKLENEEEDNKNEQIIKMNEQSVIESGQIENNDITENGNSEAATEDNTIKIKTEYERFVKMVQFGVPIEAVKSKISLEGLDPSELDKIIKK